MVPFVEDFSSFGEGELAEEGEVAGGDDEGFFEVVFVEDVFLYE